MRLEDAIEIVLEMATQNIIDDPELVAEAKRQRTAIGRVHDFFVAPNLLFEPNNKE